MLSAALHLALLFVGGNVRGENSPGGWCCDMYEHTRPVFTPSQRGAYNLTMESLLIFVLFLVVWFLVLPRIPGISRFT
jgi:hypothetical protein